MKVKVTVPDPVLGAVDSFCALTRQTRSSLVTLALVRLLHECGAETGLAGSVEVVPGDPTGGPPRRALSSPHLLGTLKSTKREGCGEGEDRTPQEDPPKTPPPRSGLGPETRLSSKAPKSPPDALEGEGLANPIKKAPKRVTRALCASAEVAFLDWWGRVPRRVGKGAARIKYRQSLILCGWSGDARDSGTLQAAAKVLLAGVARWSEAVQGTERRYVKHPASWLNQHCWEDEEDDPWATIGTALTADMSDRAKRERLDRDRDKLAVLEERLEDDGQLPPEFQAELDRLRQLVRGEV